MTRVLDAAELPASESACQRLIHCAAAHVDAGDYAAFCGLFTSDGVLERPDGSILRGPSDILAAYQRRPAHRQTLHVISNTRFVDVSENGARGISLVTLWACDRKTESGSLGRSVEQALVLGEFDDLFCRVGAEWRIAQRRARFLMHVPVAA